MHQLRPYLAAGLQDVHRPDHVRLNRFNRMHIGIWDGNERAQVKDGIHPFCGLFNCTEVAQIAAYDLDVIENLSGKLPEQTDFGAGGVAHEGTHTSAIQCEFFHQAAADEAARAGY